jgi:flotillin
MFGISLIWIIVAVIAILAVVVFTTCYVKAPPSTAYILSGVFKKPRVYVGRGGFKIPIFERLDKVYLGQFTVEVNTDGTVPTHDWIDVRVEGVAKVAVWYDPEGNIRDIVVDEDDNIVDVNAEASEGGEEKKPVEKKTLPVLNGMDGIRLAGRNFLNMTAEHIAQQLEPSLQGNLKEIVGAINLKELSTDREEFSRRVMNSAAPDMMRLGIRILSFNVQKVEDTNGLIKDLGADNTWTIKKTAAQKRAIAEREIAETQAENRNKANDANVNADLQIAQKQNDLLLKKADLKKQADTQQAIADAAYKIQEQDQQKVINEKTVEAATARTLKEQELTKQKITVAENQSDAEKRTIEIKADAEKSQIEYAAKAELEKRKREAEAQRYEAEQQAAAKKALADANRYSMEQEAAGIRAKGDAEGAAIEAKLKGEAEGMKEKAEAWKQYNDAALTQMVVDQLPEITKNIASQVGAIDGINIYSNGSDSAGIGSIVGAAPMIFAKANDTIKSAVGVDIAGLINGKRGEQKPAPATKEEKKTDSKPASAKEED